MNSRRAVKSGWPDWHVRTAVVVATGPSVQDAPLSAMRGRVKIITINDSFQLVPWADVLYASDRSWWEANEGVPQFRGLKVSASPRAAVLYPEIRMVLLSKGAKILVDPVGTIGSGSRQGNGGSGFHAVNLAVQFGAKRIVLVGFDREQELDGCLDQFSALGVDVVNASATSALKAYRKIDLTEAITG